MAKGKEIEGAVGHRINTCPLRFRDLATSRISIIEPKDLTILFTKTNHKCFFSELLSQMPEDNPIIEMKVKDSNCALCQYAMNTLYQLLENKDTEDEIKNALETVCR